VSWIFYHRDRDPHRHRLPDANTSGIEAALIELVAAAAVLTQLSNAAQSALIKEGT
jgi:hypothetical protein